MKEAYQEVTSQIDEKGLHVRYPNIGEVHVYKCEDKNREPQLEAHLGLICRKDEF